MPSFLGRTLGHTVLCEMTGSVVVRVWAWELHGLGLTSDSPLTSCGPWGGYLTSQCLSFLLSHGGIRLPTRVAVRLGELTHASVVRAPGLLSDAPYEWTIGIVVTITVSLETEKGSEPHSILRTLARGSYLPRTMQSSGTGKAGKPDPKLTHQDEARAALNPALGTGGPRAVGGLTLAPAWRTVISGGQVGRSGGVRGQAGYGAGLWVWVWGQQLRPLNCTSLGLAGEMGDVTQKHQLPRLLPGLA